MIRATLAVLFGFSTSTAFAQQFVELRPIEPIQRQAGFYEAPLVADLNGDGIADLVLAHNNGQGAAIYRGLGSGRLALANSLPFPNFRDSAVTRAADVDNDGDLDLLFTDFFGGVGVTLARNLGNLQFSVSLAGPLPSGFGAIDLILGDVDRDGDLDMFGAIPLSFARNVLWLNNGNGVFTEVTQTNLPATLFSASTAAFADTDGDGDLDLFVGSALGLKLMHNNGAGVFTEVTAVTLPVNSASVTGVAVWDCDSDGDQDVLFGASSTRLYRNNGGVFVDDTQASLPSIAGANLIYFVDIDRDGDRDAVLRPAGSMVGRDFVLLRNDGVGRFQAVPQPQLPPPPHNAYDLAVGDVDGDGWIDLFAPRNGAIPGLFLNDKTGGFRDVWTGKVPDLTPRLRRAVMADFDRDGDLDILGAGETVALFDNDGLGQFADVSSSRLVGAGAVRTYLATGDVDGDGDLDVVLAPAQLLLNDGTGVLQNAPGRLGIGSVGVSVDLGDVDGDSDLDILLATDDRTGEILLRNDGTGTFTRSLTLPPNPNRTRVARFVDIDADGDRDIVTASVFGPSGNDLGPNLIFVNDGTGTFTDQTATRLVAGIYNTFAIELGDVDRDGDVDIVFGMFINWRGRVFLNNGAGVFSEAPSTFLPFADDNHETMHLFDADEDGDLDLAGGSSGFFSNGRFVTYFYRNGGNGFTEEIITIDRSSISALVSGDTDGDGDLDLFTYGVQNFLTGGDQRPRLLTNCRRQLEVPDLMLPGGAPRLVHYARKPLAAGSHVAIAILSAGRLPVPLNLPFGRLFIDLGTSLTLPGIVVPLFPSSIAQPLQVPPNPGLTGATVYLQAVSLVDVDPFNTLRLTNAVARTLR